MAPGPYQGLPHVLPAARRGCWFNQHRIWPGESLSCSLPLPQHPQLVDGWASTSRNAITHHAPTAQFFTRRVAMGMTGRSGWLVALPSFTVVTWSLGGGHWVGCWAGPRVGWVALGNAPGNALGNAPGNALRAIPQHLAPLKGLARSRRDGEGGVGQVACLRLAGWMAKCRGGGSSNPCDVDGPPWEQAARHHFTKLRFHLIPPDPAAFRVDPLLFRRESAIWTASSV